jgi:hypothetical protein
MYQDFKATKELALTLPLGTMRKVSGSNPFTASNTKDLGFCVMWNASSDINCAFDAIVENPFGGQLKARQVDFFTILSK